VSLSLIVRFQVSVFRRFETQILRLLVIPKLDEQVVSSIEQNAEFVNYEYSGCGYFLTVRHPDIPHERIVCDKPFVSGLALGIRSGFVIFIQNGQLMLECHELGEPTVPANYRDLDVAVSVT
jgi:hypothetical protein